MSTVSAIVAARNEESHIAETVLSLAAQPEVREIIVVNDESTDRTAAILADVASRVPQLRVLEAGELPAGWLGKNHALWLGAAEAQGEWLLFTDADVTHLPGSTARALADAARKCADLVSYSPEQETRTWWERAVIPFVFTRLARLFPFEKVNDPASPIAAANGQFLLIRRDTYDAIGGHAAVRGEVVEDVALARRAKAAGYRLHFAPGIGIARTRMYSSFGAMWQGWTKNLYTLVKESRRSQQRRAALIEEYAQVWCWSAVPLALVPGGPWTVALAFTILLVGHWLYALDLRRIGAPLESVLYYLPASLLYGLMLTASAGAHRNGRVSWKGREYPVSAR